MLMDVDGVCPCGNDDRVILFLLSSGMQVLELAFQNKPCLDWFVYQEVYGVGNSIWSVFHAYV